VQAAREEGAHMPRLCAVLAGVGSGLDMESQFVGNSAPALCSVRIARARRPIFDSGLALESDTCLARGIWHS
jgi:hypothetical protein